MAEVEALVFDKKIHAPDLMNQAVKLNYQEWQTAIRENNVPGFHG